MGNISNKIHKSKNKNSNKDESNKNVNVDDDGDYSFLRGIHPPSLMNYKFSDRRVQYYSEKIEISEEEKKLISKIKSDKIELFDFPDNDDEITKIIIDTDIGTDWDDSMALSYAFNIPNLEILGITTNYGIPDLRASITKKIRKKSPSQLLLDLVDHWALIGN